MSDPKNSQDSGAPIFSQGSEDGPSLSSWLDSQSPSPSGPDPVPVSRSPSRARGRARKTSGTSGLNSSGSSESAALQSSLESRLRARMAATGSLEYVLTWKGWDMRSGGRICALRARARKAKDGFCVGVPFISNEPSSEPPTSGSAFTGWPTPRTPTGGPESAERKKELGRKDSGGGDLQAVALMAGWPTPDAGMNTFSNPEVHMARIAKIKELRKNGNGAGLPLAIVAHLAGWPTPQAGSPATDGYNEAGNTDSSRRTVALVSGHLAPSEAARMAGWSTPSARDGKHPNLKSYKERGGAKKGEQLGNQVVHQAIGAPLMSSPAETGKRGVLSPEHSRWLMGFPPEWASCAPTEMPSSRKRRPPSSKPS